MSTSEEPVPIDPTAFRHELRDIYATLAEEVAHHGPVCRLSGHCCRFDEYGHTLFLSAPRPRYSWPMRRAGPRTGPRTTCPWQDVQGHCTAREARPLGCRVYYCDPEYQLPAQALSETFINRLKQLADRHGLPWQYAPLHWHLRRLAEAGLFPRTP